MIQQGSRKLYTAAEKYEFLRLFELESKQLGFEPNVAKFAEEHGIPTAQIRLWRQLHNAGVSLNDTKPLAGPPPDIHKRAKAYKEYREGNGKTEKIKEKRWTQPQPEPEPEPEEEFEETPYDEVEDEPKPATRHKIIRPTGMPVQANEVTREYWAQQMITARLQGRDKIAPLHELFKKTGFHPATLAYWTREYEKTPKGKKFTASVTPKPKPVIKKAGKQGRPATSRYQHPTSGALHTWLAPAHWNQLVDTLKSLQAEVEKLTRTVDDLLGAQTVLSTRVKELSDFWK